MLKQSNSSPQSDIRCARDVIAREVEGLQAVSNAFDERFVSVVEMLAGLRGRLIVSGIGKSGHIARKIAATLASTGTPAHFVHPSEASHGDLGMITREDAVLLLSNSGETAELSDIITYTRRYGIPLIGLVRRESSMLVEAADYAMVLPEVPEASPVGAPTTSTIMMLAWGDALAMALLERRGFTTEDFGVLHPGGRLGQAFMRVEDLMHGAEELPLANTDMLMRDALIVMTAKHFGCLGVVDGTALVGLITDGDLRRKMGDDLLSLKVTDVMTKSPVTTSARALASEALGIMNNKSITCLFVVDDEHKPVGIIHIHDCLRAGVV